MGVGFSFQFRKQPHLQTRGDAKMKTIFYVAFAALVLVSAILILKPEDKTSEIAETPKYEQPHAVSPDSKPAHEVVKEEKPIAEEPHEAPKTGLDTSAKQGDSLKAQEGLPFDRSEVPVFPPLPPMEEDDSDPFGDLPAQGFGNDDFAKDDFGTDQGLFGEGEGWEELDSGELK
jgi:hypothetical protein